MRKVIDRLGHERAHCLNINGPFQETWNVMGGMQNTMLGFFEAPDLVHGVLEEVTRFNQVLMSEAAQIGVDFFMVDAAKAFGCYADIASKPLAAPPPDCKPVRARRKSGRRGQRRTEVPQQGALDPNFAPGQYRESAILLICPTTSLWCVD